MSNRRVPFDWGVFRDDNSWQSLQRPKRHSRMARPVYKKLSDAQVLKCVRRLVLHDRSFGCQHVIAESLARTLGVRKGSVVKALMVLNREGIVGHRLRIRPHDGGWCANRYPIYQEAQR